MFYGEEEVESQAQTTESVVLEEELPEDYEPTQDEIIEYAKWLGMDTDSGKDTDLYWIAREGLKAPLPENWKPCQTGDHEIYYFNFATGESVWDHPCDEYYRNLYHEEAEKKVKREEDKSKKKEEKDKKKKVCAFWDTRSQSRVVYTVCYLRCISSQMSCMSAHVYARASARAHGSQKC